MSRYEHQAFFKAILAGRVRTVCGYLDSGVVDINEPGPEGYTPLIQAVYVGKEDVRSHIVRLLVRHGCDVNIADDDGRTALVHACMLKNRDDVIRRIISTGSCDPNVCDLTGNSALWHAASSGNHLAIRQLVNDAHTKTQLEVDRSNNDGLSPLAEAVTWGHGECVRILINESGASKRTVSDIARLEYMLREIDPVESQSRPVTSRSMGQTSLRLERISLHSRHSVYPPDVENIQTDRSDPGEGCSDLVHGNVTYHGHGAHRLSRTSLELPILNPLPNQTRDHCQNNNQQHSAIPGYTDWYGDDDDDNISIISQYSLTPHAEQHQDDHVTSSSPIVVGSPSGGGSSLNDNISSSLLLPMISTRSPSPSNNDRVPSYDVIHKPHVTSSYDNSHCYDDTQKKGGRQRSKSTALAK